MIKKCKVCKEPFNQLTSLHVYCSTKCTIEATLAKIDKKVARQELNAATELKRAKEAIKTRQDWIKEVQTAVNAYVRKRDDGLPCISCGKPTKTGDHAGHYRAATHSPTRFNELNINLQCVQCNVFFHGNVANYRLGLIAKIGLDAVLEIESNSPPAKWCIDDLKSLKLEYKIKLKALKS